MSAFLAVSMVVQTLYFWPISIGWDISERKRSRLLAWREHDDDRTGAHPNAGCGTTTLISHAAGRKDQPQAELVFNQSFVMSILIAFALGVVDFCYGPLIVNG